MTIAFKFLARLYKYYLWELNTEYIWIIHSDLEIFMMQCLLRDAANKDSSIYKDSAFKEQISCQH